jgi:hypothetical protein
MAPERRTAHSGLLAVLLVVLVGCRSNSPLPTEEAVRRAQACITPDTNIRYLPADRPDFEECLEKVMREPAGRRYLLDAGNEAVAGWSADMARFVGDDLSLDPNRSLGQALAGLSAVPAGGGTGKRVGRFYRQLVRAVFANVKDRRTAAAEVGGTMRSCVSQGPGKPAESFIRAARERLPDGDDEVDPELTRMVRHGMEQLIALSLWAEERVRNALLAGDPPDVPATPPPTATPLLEDPPGRLHIPGPHEQPAHDIFFNWYEHKGGLPLRAAAGGVVHVSGILERFLR